MMVMSPCKSKNKILVYVWLKIHMAVLRGRLA